MKPTLLSEIINAKQSKLALPQELVASLCIDSRSVFETKGSLYVALQGPRTDGHKYITELYEMGIRQFVVSNESVVVDLENINYWLVDNTLTALQKLAAYQRSSTNIPVIGITGSNGKTIVKEWLNHALRDVFQICRSPKSYNSQIGVSLSVWNLNENHTLGIFEAGISLPQEMDALKQIINPTIGVFTHLGSAHQEHFDSSKHKAIEKLHLFEHSEVLFYPEDQPELNAAVVSYFVDSPIELCAWSRTNNKAWMFVSSEVVNASDTKSNIIIDGGNYSVNIPFTHVASLNNAYACIAVWYYLKLSWGDIQEKLSSLPKLEMRLELLKGVNQCTIINDAYSLDIDSLKIALDFQHSHNEHKSKIIILSDLPGATSNQDAYRYLASLLLAANVRQFIAVGEDYFPFKHLFQDIPTTYIQDTLQLIDHLKKSELRKSTILVKGARKYGFEQIIKVLVQFEHQTRLEINLNAIQYNLNAYKQLLKPKTKVMAMVKAFSYGSGSHEIAQLLQFNNIDYLAVAFTNEAIALKNNDIQVPIMIMNAEPNSFEQIIEHRLEPEIYSLKILTHFAKTLREQGVSENYPIHIKLETGMNRLGFTQDEIQLLLKILSDNKQLKVASIFSHLAASDDVQHDDFTREQIALFNTTSKKIEQELGYPVLKHLANSAAISRFPSAHFDMVRLGIGLYGHTADEVLNQKLQVVAQLKTTITQIKEVSGETTIGYGRQFKTKNVTKIATLPIGYADGLRRGLNLKHAFVVINDKPAYYVGNICMDMCMVDVTHIQCNEGDEVEVFGTNPSLTKLAKWYNTIPYEVICNISQRVKRIYFKD